MGNESSSQSYTSAELEAERKKMVTVNRAPARGGKASSADAKPTAAQLKRAELLKSIEALPPPVEPLIAVTAQRRFLSRRDRVSEEVLRQSAIFRPLPEGEVVKCLATLQTKAMVASDEAAAHHAQCVREMDACAFQCQLLKSRLVQQSHAAKQVDMCMADAAALEADMHSVAEECSGISALIEDIEALLPAEDLSAVRAELRRDADDPQGCFSCPATPAGTPPSTTPRATPAVSPRSVSPSLLE